MTPRKPRRTAVGAKGVAVSKIRAEGGGGESDSRKESEGDASGRGTGSGDVTLNGIEATLVF